MLAKSQKFISTNGSKFYNLPLNLHLLSLQSLRNLLITQKLMGNKFITVFDPDFPLYWKSQVIHNSFKETN